MRGLLVSCMFHLLQCWQDVTKTAPCVSSTPYVKPTALYPDVFVLTIVKRYCNAIFIRVLFIFAILARKKFS